MAEVINASTEKLTTPPSPSPDKTNDNNTDLPPDTSPPPQQQRRGGGPVRERDFREREFDRRPRRDYDNRRSPPLPHRPGGGGGGYHNQKRGRNLSPSPPPPPFNNNNNRGPRRSPPFKRRRDNNNNNNNNNNGYEGRRGSPPHHRGGFGGRRFGHDNPGGYDREGGSRPGYPDERPRGRLMGRLSGPYHGGPDWDSGPGGYTDAFNGGGTQREGMMSYKQFMLELEDDILPAEAERRYQEYKTEYISTQKRNYFNAHKGEQWLKDKYHPTNLVSVIERRNEVARKLAKDFQLDLHSGTLDLGPSFKPSFNKAEHSSRPNSDDEAEMGGKRKRPAHAGAKSSDSSSAPQTHPVFSESRRVHIDVVQTQALVRRLDIEKGIEENVLCRSDDRPSRDKSHGSSSGPVIIIRGSAAVKGLEGIELLDTLLTYLWRVHGVDYYGLVESSEPKGIRHIRATAKHSEANISSAKESENKLDSHWQERMKGSDPMEVMTGKEKLDAAAAEALDPYVRKIRDEKYGWKYGCGAKGCTKLFHASEFVQKHLKLKHPELLTEVMSKVREELYFQNYMNDENAPGAAPIMQPSFPKEKPQRRRPGIEARIKDDRGNNRNGNEWFDRSDNARSTDFNKDGDPGNNQDEPMFDTFSGSVGVFGSDMAPPMLMPVPGAGPLGPFVPAPPEVAMRMFRDQGGPFEGGRTGMSGPQLTAPGPIIGMPPNFRQDPRRLRSYNDLDAPDDEVTVIDYRSL